MIILKYTYSKLKWRFSVYNITGTCDIQNIDSIVKEYTKRWLCLLQSANTRHIYLSVKTHAMKFDLPSDIYNSQHIKPV